MQKKIIVLMTFISFSLFAQDIDQELSILIKKHNLNPLGPPTPFSEPLVRLGAMLFHETELSGPRNINCASCHHPRFGTSDGLPFSIGQGGIGMGPTRSQESAGLTRRNSPTLINIGFNDIEHMFWDGRVYRNKETGELQTPEPALNGKNPKRSDIAKVFTSALSVQTIFPIQDALEMRGHHGNDIAEASDSLEAWDKAVSRLLKINDYVEQFQKAYPGTNQINIGHVGEALGAFISTQFIATETPYDRYIEGNKSAMTHLEKKGLKVFLTRGQCINCHNGRHLSNFEFKSVGTPQVSWEKTPEPYDLGRYEVTSEKRDMLKFRTPPLRNLLLTPPYMHSGVFNNLEEVLEHYNDPETSLNNYNLSQFNSLPYSDHFVLDQDKRRNKLRISLISIGEVRRGLKLTDSEKESLLQFLKTGLLDIRFQRNRSL